jgi:hypothetical protein
LLECFLSFDSFQRSPAPLIGERLSCLLRTSQSISEFPVTVVNAKHVLLDCASQLRSPDTGLAPKDESEHETNPERGKDRFRRVLADVLLAVVSKTADAMARIMPYSFRTAQIFIGRCARGRAEIFRRFPRVRHATLCFFFRLRRNRRALIHLVFVSHRFPLLHDLFKLSVPMLR